MQKWLLPTLSEILAASTPTRADSPVSPIGETAVMENANCRVTSRTGRERVKAEREWCGAIAALEDLLVQTLDTIETDCSQPERQVKGLVLAGPVPILSDPAITSNFQTGIFTSESFNALGLMPFQLPPATATCTEPPAHVAVELPLLAADPLASEQFCLVFTTGFSLVMVLGEDITGTTAFHFSFDPEEIKQAWRALRARVLLGSRHQLNNLDALVEQFAPTTPDYRTVMHFSRQLLKHIPEETIEQRRSPLTTINDTHPVRAKESRNYSSLEDGSITQLIQNPKSKIQNPKSDDIELLQALTHEIRTPLTTIRTLTRLMLKRRDLTPDTIRRLEIIDHECTEQINRMELIFRAVELATSEFKETQVHLTPMSLHQLLQQSIPRWEKQAQRRNLTIEVTLPQKLPEVVSNPGMLDQVLTGLMENFTRSLPAGGHIQVEVTPAGDQLKLQLQSQPYPDETGICPAESVRKSIGQLLMFQPETGSLSLNMNVTKNLFQVLGGKLIVRQRPQQGEVLTIFLPLEVSSAEAVKYEQQAATP